MVKRVKLIITIEVPCDPALEDPEEIATYCLDGSADDPDWTLLSAKWEA
jgi:hypothetical protein